MRKIFPVCCAEATAPPKVIVRAKANIAHHFGFWIADGSTLLTTGFRLSDRNQRNAVRDVLVMCWCPNLKSKIATPKLFNDSVRSRKHIRRDHEIDLLGGLKTNYKLNCRRQPVLCWLL
jgi:hypothetical protein